MFIARFSYDVLPVNRDQALQLIAREVAGARARGLSARLLIPLTRGQGGSALQYEVEVESLGLLDQFRTSGIGSEAETASWMREFSALLTAPPAVEILRVAE